MQTKRKTGCGNKTRISARRTRRGPVPCAKIIIVLNILIWFGNYGTMDILERKSRGGSSGCSLEFFVRVCLAISTSFFLISLEQDLYSHPLGWHIPT